MASLARTALVLVTLLAVAAVGNASTTEDALNAELQAQLDAAAAAAVPAPVATAVSTEEDEADEQNAEGDALLDADEDEQLLASFVQLSGDPMRRKAKFMARRFVSDMEEHLKQIYPVDLAAKSKAHSQDFDVAFRQQCRQVAPSAKMCRNFVTIYRLTFLGNDVFSAEHKPRFVRHVARIIYRYVLAWRRWAKDYKNRNPWRVVKGKRDPMWYIRIRTPVFGSLNLFGRINANRQNNLLPKPDNIPSGTALPTNDDGTPASPPVTYRHVKELHEQVKKDLAVLRDRVHIRMDDWQDRIRDKNRAKRSIKRAVRICKRLRKKQFLAPTFCKSFGYLASVNWAGRNPFGRGKLDDFAALMAAFMDHNHKLMTRYGYHVVRRPNYKQDVAVVSVNLGLRVPANKFNLRSLAREFINVLSNVMSIPERRVRVASMDLGRRKVRVTFEFLPKRSDRRTFSRPELATSVDALAEQFVGMAKNIGSDFYKVPLLSRIHPNSILVTKTLGIRRKDRRRARELIASLRAQSRNIRRAQASPRFSETEIAQSVAQYLAEEAAERMAAQSAAGGEVLAIEDSSREAHDDSEQATLERDDQQEFFDADAEEDDGMDAVMLAEEQVMHDAGSEGSLLSEEELAEDAAAATASEVAVALDAQAEAVDQATQDEQEQEAEDEAEDEADEEEAEADEDEAEDEAELESEEEGEAEEDASSEQATEDLVLLQVDEQDEEADEAEDEDEQDEEDEEEELEEEQDESDDEADEEDATEEAEARESAADDSFAGLELSLIDVAAEAKALHVAADATETETETETEAETETSEAEEVAADVEEDAEDTAEEAAESDAWTEAQQASDEHAPSAEDVAEAAAGEADTDEATAEAETEAEAEEETEDEDQSEDEDTEEAEADNEDAFAPVTTASSSLNDELPEINAATDVNAVPAVTNEVSAADQKAADSAPDAVFVEMQTTVQSTVKVQDLRSSSARVVPAIFVTLLFVLVTLLL